MKLPRISKSMPSNSEDFNGSGLFTHINETRNLDLVDAKLEASRKLQEMVKMKIISVGLGGRWKSSIQEGKFAHVLSRIERYSKLLIPILSGKGSQTKQTFEDELRGLYGIINRCYSLSDEYDALLKDLIRIHMNQQRASRGLPLMVPPRRLCDPDPSLRLQIVPRGTKPHT